MKILVICTILFCPVILSGAEYSYIYNSDTAVSYIQLPHKNIFKNTIHINSQTQDSIAIKRIDYVEGIIVLGSPQKIEAAQISYEYLAYNIQNYFFKRKLDLDNGKSVHRVKPQKLIGEKPLAEPPGNFRISGSKSIGVSAGNLQDFDLNQTLKIQVRGEPVEGLALTGSISDRAQPQVGGLSSSLEDIETVSLLAQGKKFNVSIGDINYKNNWGGIAEISKRLKGVEGNIEYDRIWSRAAVSGVKGRFKSVEFRASEGLSGPYDLKSDNGSRISIVAGTERVYLDGRPLRAGASEDYIIDYGLGEITFTPQIILTSNSRIQVDYEYLDQSYRRNLYSAELGGWLLPQTLKLDVGYLELSDSRSNPVDLSLSGGDIATLESAGDDYKAAVRSGIEYTGENPGNYIQLADSLGNVYYQFVADSLGQYNITFTRVDRNQGDYSYQGNGVYVFQGRNQGNYLPFEYLPLPAKNQALYLNGLAQIGRYASLDLNLAGSNFDRNSYSALDDGDNQAFRGNLDLNFTPLDHPISRDFISGLSTRINLHTRERSFTLPGRSEALELHRIWALENDTVYKRSDRLEIFQQIDFLKYLKTESELGFYRDNDSVSSDRNRILFSIFPLNGVQFDISRRDAVADLTLAEDSSSGRLYQDQISTKLNYKDNSLTLGWRDESDTRRNSPGSTNARQYDQYFSELAVKNLQTGFSYTDQTSLGSISSDSYRDYLFSLSYSGAILNKQVTPNFTLVRRQVEYDSDLLSDLTETKLSSQTGFKFLTGAVTGNLTYRLNRQRISRLARNFIKVEEGQGNYRLEDSVYVRDPYGDYVLIDELVDEGSAGLLSEKGLQLKIDLLKFIPARTGLASLNSETVFKLEERGGNDYRLNSLYLVPFWRSYPDNELYSRFEIRQVLSLGTANGHNISLGFEEKSVVDQIRDLNSNRYQRLIYEKAYLLFSPQAKLIGEHRFKRERERSGYFGSADFGEHDIVVKVQIFPNDNLELSLAPRYLHDYSKSDNLEVDMLGAELSPALSFSNRGRLELDFSYYNVSAGEERFIPYQYASGNRPGDNYEWSTVLNYKYSRAVTAQFKYSADKIPGLKTRHRVSLNVKAGF